MASGAMLLVMWRHRRNQARGDSLHLIGRDRDRDQDQDRDRKGDGDGDRKGDGDRDGH